MSYFILCTGNQVWQTGVSKQNFETGFDAVWITTRKQRILDGLKERLEENDLLNDSVAFRLLRQFSEEENLPS